MIVGAPGGSAAAAGAAMAKGLAPYQFAAAIRCRSDE